ncbi:DIS3-like exonuclease 2 isoform X2 [Monomorium pharaonis]|uniref:DIS3-like exonuclease 2 isoform X2 n=1 Tax=Monomorium pharaonis TaxID=307658 RepID=UPI00063FBB24|nr:DIS3-like exonuclease 2 isoform X2 [Monomorium pharaonis]
MPKCSKVDVKESQDATCYKRHVSMCKDERKRCIGTMILTSLTSEAFVTRYDKLTELSAQLATNLRISQSLQFKRLNTRCNGEIVSSEIKGQVASNLPHDAVQDNTMHFTQEASTSQTSQDDRSEGKHSGAVQKCQNSVKERTEVDENAIVLANNECKTENLVTNQANTHNNKRKRSRLRKNTKNNAEVENNSSVGNIQKENCGTDEIKTNNEGKKMEKVFKKLFSNYIPVPRMMNILNKQSSSHNVQYIKGHIRINPFCRYAYLHMDNEERDLLIVGLPNRNRAFEGDLVVACILPEKYWHKCADGEIQKTGKVVCILEKMHSRKAVGYLKKQDSLFVFYPRDQRIPLVDILPESVPSLYHDQPELYKNIIFFVNIDFWEQLHAFGRIISIVGKSGEIDTELKAIILENNLDVSPYHETLLKGLPGSDYTLTEADMKNREDWRHECVFSIDPLTAVDIDDAISCKVLDNGNYEIAVHISDVTHYLEFFSPLDKEVLKRATTVYLPHMTSHMLPEQLCKVCSLLPGKDRLAFSVIWEITLNAEIIKHRFAKTVIRSCCQMSYDSAQIMIDNPDKSWPEDFLEIKGDYTVSLLSDIVNKLFKLSTQLQKKRFVHGALRLDQPKLHIRLDFTNSQEHGIPIPVDYCTYERNSSNSLIEELMLLANMTVAEKLFNAIPKMALLRIHKEPSKHCLNTVYNILQKYGIHLNIETAGALQASISRYEPENNFVAVDSMKYIMMVIINLCSKSMTRAEYICASTTSPYNLKHYALSVPLYTHFTSPIRRYSDCVVHRLLSATLENKPLPEKWTVKLCSKIATNCNVKKYSAKLAQEQSTEVFFAYMVGLAGGFEAAAIVMCVREDGIEIILCDTGIKLKISLKDIEYVATTKYSANDVPTITVNWKEPAIVQIINLFSMVRVHVNKISEELRLKATLLPPSQQ